METERILITVRTYPTISKAYTETVCTGGINDQGEWRRLYPVPLRYLEGESQYRTYDVVEVKLKQGKDGRPETRRPENQTLQVVGHLENASIRHQWISNTIVQSMRELKEKKRSIGAVKVNDVLDFLIEPVDPNWSPAEREKLSQFNLFTERKELEKIPFKFRLQWRDGEGEEYTNTFIAWEVFQTWRSWRLNYDNVEQRIRDKWMNQVLGTNKDVSFFMGNLASRRKLFMVCGTYQPLKGITSHGQFLF